MDALLQKCDAPLRQLLHSIDSTNLQKLSRLPAPRLQTSAVPNIGTIELVRPEAYEESYKHLYLSEFHGAERERTDLIVERLREQFAGKRNGLAPFRVVGIRDHQGNAIAGAQFSVLMLRTNEDNHDKQSNSQQRNGIVKASEFAVPYLHYIYVRASNRRQDLSEVLHTFILAVAVADAKASSSSGEGQGREIPFTLFETEPPNHGNDHSHQANATQRTAIHARSGARAMMLRHLRTGKITSAHVQPGLEPGDLPLTLCWAVRPSPTGVEYDCGKVGRACLEAYYRSFRDEGFLEGNIALAERMVERRCEGAEFVEMALADVTGEMYQNLEIDEVRQDVS